MASQRKLEVVIAGDSRQLQRAFGQAGKSADTFGRKLSRGAGAGLAAFGKVGGVAAAAVGVGMVAAFKHGIKGAMDHQKVMAQTRSVLKSTGNAVNTSTAAIERNADALERKTGIDADVIQSGMNLMATFGNVRNQTGKLNDIFDQANRTALDMSVTFGTSVQASSIQLGKALQDPIKGVTALTRVGVSFSAQQKEQIETLVKSGKTLEAQKLILAEVNKQVGGSAKAYGKTLPGQIDRAKRAFDRLTETIAGPLLPLVADLAEGLLSTFQSPALQASLTSFSEGVANAIRKVVGFIGEFKKASGLKGKAQLVLELAKNGLNDLRDAIGSAISAIDWGKVGSTIATGISSGLKFTTETINRLVTSLTSAIVKNADKVADAGAVIAAKVVARLLDPAWWAKHWKEALTIALAVIPIGKLGQLGGLLVRMLLKPFAKLGGLLVRPVIAGLEWVMRFAATKAFSIGTRIVAMIANGLMRFATVAANFTGKLLAPLGRFGTQAAQAVYRGISNLAGVVTRVGSRAVGGIVRALSNGVGGVGAAALRVGKAILDGIRRFLSDLPRVVKGLLRLGLAAAIVSVVEWVLNRAADIGRALVNGIKNGISNLIGGLGGWLGSKLGGILKSLNIKGGSPVEHSGGKFIGAPLMAGAAAAVAKNAPKLAKNLSAAVKSAVLEARSNLAGLTGNLGGMLGTIIGESSPQAKRLRQIRAQQTQQDRVRERARLTAAIAEAETDEERAQARQDLADWELDQEAQRLEESIANQQAANERSLADLTAKFNTGKISAKQFRAELDKLIGGQTGADLGYAFATEFGLQLAAVKRQIASLLKTPTELGGPDTISPRAVASEQLRDWEKRRKEHLAKLNARYRDKKSAGGTTITDAEKELRAEEMGKWYRNNPKPRSLPKVQKAAMGGILRRAVLAGEAGPEAVLPLSSGRAQRMLAEAMDGANRLNGYGGTTVVNVTVSGNEFSAHEFARKLAPELRRQVALTRSV